MIEFVEKLHILETLNWILCFFVILQIVLFFLTILFATSKGVLRRLIHLLCRKEHLLENITGFTLWVISVFSYWYFFHLMTKINTDLQIENSFQTHPYISWYVLLSTISLCFFIPIDAVQRFVDTQKRINQLKNWEVLEKILGFLSWIPLEKIPIPGPWKIGIRFVITLGRKGIEAIIAQAVRNRISAFLLRSTVELGIRVSIIIGAVYCATSEITFW